MRSETPEQDRVHPLWRLAFRAGFLGAGAFAVLAMLRWLGWMLWPADWDYSLYPTWWHAHEMVFGFAMPVVAGFLLTAVANWTGIPGTRGRRLQFLFGFWLLARLTLWVLPGQLWLAWLAEMLFLSLLIAELTRRIWAVRQWRNMWFPPLLLLLALLSSASYAAVENMEAARRLHYGAIWIVTVLIVIIGGRVIPLFTGNRLGISISPLPAWLEWLAIASTVAIGVITALGAWHAAAGWARALCLGCGILHLLRLAHWRGWKTTRVPLLWSMHLAYLCIPLAMFGLALAGADPTAHKNIIHLLAVGSMGGMILAMMARVSLGHTGRPLEVPGYLAAAFGLVFLAAAIRAFLPLSGEAGLIHWAWRLSAGLWVLAFALFLVRYLPVLSRPRVDGKPG